ncbi:MAG: chemotaxis protein CheW [Rickettsiales bacterium]|nr:chemotaxis protein CheW [Rickettsiales bacterium]
MNDLVVHEDGYAEDKDGIINDYLIFHLGNQAFCIHVAQVRDVLRLQKLTHVPLSEEGIAGVMNLRGHIVTAIDARVTLGVPLSDEVEDLSVVVEFEEELYSIIVDGVRDVFTFMPDEMDTNPSILEGKLREVANGVIKRDNELIVCLDVPKLFHMVKPLAEEVET